MPLIENFFGCTTVGMFVMSDAMRMNEGEDLRPDVDWAYLRGTACRSIANDHHEAA